MASNQRARNLDKSTGRAVSGLEWALQEFAAEAIRPDEFTLAQFVAASGMNRNSARARLVDREKTGELTSRIGCVAGKSARIYRKAKAICDS